jgi:extracellular elastinolytic metalloproteinase
MGGKCAVGVALALLAFPVAGVAQARERADRGQWQNRLGRQGVVDLDRSTGTPRMLARLDGTLTGASSRSPEAVASAYVRANLGALGLSAGDVTGTPVVEKQPGGVTSVEWHQAVGGIPAADHALRVNVGRDGRVLNVLGSPAHDLTVPTTTPALDAGEAVRAVQDDVGSHRSLVRRGAPRGARRTTSYGDDTSASLATFDGRLAWRVQYRADADAVYDATVDARTGTVLRRVNMVKRDTPASVWERFPGSGPGGTANPVDLEHNGWLSTSATTLNGPNVHTYSDLDDNDVASASEEVTKTGGGFSFPLQPVGGTGCDAAHLCAWSSTADRTANRQQDAVQAFYFANRFHDHLASLGFTGAMGAFEGADDLLLETMDGASTGPNGDHLNNANMFTPPDGSHPRMQMYLWSSPFRRISSGSDAAIVYHEYTHGLSNRLVHDADGYGAVNSAQAGAMGEAWSDFYAMDFIVDQFPELDTGAAGEVVMGAYTDLPGSSSKLRFSPLDCPPVGADPVACPGRPAIGSGGFTYGDFGRIAGGPEVHSDGEIWAQTLWDLRTAVGPAKARALVTTGMSLLAPEPSFLDARNAIFLADQTLYAGADVTTLWTVFAGRGMGFYAAALSGDDTAPAESFALPPAAGGARGTITGRVTNAIGGTGVAGVTVGLAGGLGTVSAVTGADGRYTIADVPAGSYLKVTAGGGGWEGPVTALSLGAGATLTYDAVVKRDWAASKGGAAITGSNGREWSDYGCGPNAAVDQSQALGWSTTAGSEKYLIVQLPEAVDVTQFGLDPTETCGDSSDAATAGYRVETSPDGTTWAVASAGTFTSANRRTLNLVTPGAGTSGVRYARLTLLSSQGTGAQFKDLSEFAVYGTPVAAADTTPPETTLEAGGPPFRFSSNEPATFECKLDDGDFAPCTSPFTPTAADGPHTFSVRARDAAGNVDDTPETRAFTLGVTGPAITGLAGPANRTNDTTPTFTFGADDAGATFECKLEALEVPGQFEPCSSPWTSAPLEQDARYTFTVRARDAAGNPGAGATWAFTLFTAAPQTGISSGPEGVTRDATPRVEFASSPPGATFTCSLNGDPIVPCTSPLILQLGADGDYTFSVTATDDLGNVDPTPAVRRFTLDTIAPETFLDATPPATVHAGPLAFAVRAGDGTVACALDDGEYGSCATLIRAESLPVGEHVFRARAEDAAGNIDASPAEFRFTVVNGAPTAALAFDVTTGPAPLTARPTIAGADPDRDPLTYTLDFGDGQVARGALPVALVAHRYEAPGAYTARLTVSDGRATAQAEQAVVVTTPQGTTPTPLTLALSAASVDLGTFITGVARDYAASLTATTTGGGTLTVADTGANAGHLAGPAGMLAQPLTVRATSGAFAPLTSAVAVPNAVEFRQPIGAGEVLRPGAYTKALTFTLAVTTP